MKLNWGNYIFIFIIIFLSLCTIFIIFSLRQDIDLVTDDYYEEGADYTSEMKIIERSAIYNDSISTTQREEVLVISISESLTSHVAAFQLWFYRPSDKENDYRTVLNIGEAPLSVDKNNLLHGRYIMHVSWVINDEEYVVKKDIFIN